MPKDQKYDVKGRNNSLNRYEDDDEMRAYVESRISNYKGGIMRS